jgi:uncharacterized protein with FMN-binding domain
VSESAYYQSLGVRDPDLTLFGDGRYPGEYSLSPPFGVFVAQNHVEVDVIIQDHSYEDIIVKTDSVKNMEHLKKMRQLILERQTLQIDALTGATSLTGKAYLNAIAGALR